MPYIQDRSQFPLVIDVMSGESHDEDIARYIAAHKELLDRKQIYAAVLDARAGKMMSAPHRKQIADWLKSDKARLEQFHASLAFVAASAILRGILTAVYWVAPPPYPYKIFEHIDDAKTWTLARIAERAGREIAPTAVRKPDGT